MVTRPTRDHWALHAPLMAIARHELSHARALHPAASAAQENNLASIRKALDESGLDMRDPRVHLAMWTALGATAAAVRDSMVDAPMLPLLAAPTMTVAMALLEVQPIEAAEAEMAYRPAPQHGSGDLGGA